MIDLIVPTVNGREDSLDRCVSSYQEQSAVSLNVIIVPESKNCGWGWIQGLQAGSAPYVLLACDDQEAISDRWAERCIETVETGALPCPRVWNGDGSLESNGGNMGMLHHLDRRHHRDGTEVDYTPIPFMSREQSERIGMLPVQYAGDVWVSYRGRQLGYETVLRHGFDIKHHHAQIGRGAGMPQDQRDKMDCETVFKALDQEQPSPDVVDWETHPDLVQPR